MGSSKKCLIDDWLNESKIDTWPPSQLQSYAISLKSNLDLISDLFNVLEDESFHEQYLTKICDQLYRLHRCKEEKLRVFSLMFIPPLIGIHLCQASNASSSLDDPIALLLLSLYNLEVINEDGEPMRRHFRLPILSKPSVYHEPGPVSMAVSTQNATLTETALMHFEFASSETNLLSFGPYSEYDAINSGNRLEMASVLLRVFNYYLSAMPKQAYLSACNMAIKVIRYGASSNVTKSVPSVPRNNFSSKTSARIKSKIQLSSWFLIELLNSIYFSLFNGISSSHGIKALKEVHKKAIYSLYPDVILMSKAIKNSLKLATIKGDEDQLSNSNIALSPTSLNEKSSLAASLQSTSYGSATNISKTAITNASFRTKKLPDDIPIIPSNSPATTGAVTGAHLSSINEEANDDATEKSTCKASGITSNNATPSSVTKPSVVAKLPVLHLIKDRKDKKREAARSKSRSDSCDSVSGSTTQSVPPAVAMGYKQLNDGGDSADIESDTSGISEAKSDFGSDQESIPLTCLSSPRAKSFIENDHHSSSNAIGGETSTTLPLMKGSSLDTHFRNSGQNQAETTAFSHKTMVS